MNLPGPAGDGLVEAFRRDPLAVLLAVHQVYGDVVALAGRPLLSRGRGELGCVAVSGPTWIEPVLHDTDTFAQPASVHEREGLGGAPRILGGGLFSMTGVTHRERRRVVGPLFTDAHVTEVTAGCASVVDGWPAGGSVPLLAAARGLAQRVVSRLVFGADGGDLPARLSDLLALRRALRAAPATGRDDLVARYTADCRRADAALRERVRAARDGHAVDGGLLAELALTRDGDGAPLPEDELVAHGNSMFVAGSEPVAVALFWTVLLLSQVASLRAGLRDGDAALADRVVRESLRLVPPNALMVRVTTRDTDVGGHRVPAGCEVLVSPFVEHRRAEAYADPHRFDPDRWLTLRPSAYEYLPFGAGARHCLGRRLATSMLTAAVAAVASRFDVTLDGDQPVDWQVDRTLLPMDDVAVRLGGPGRTARGGSVLGPVRSLLALPGAS